MRKVTLERKKSFVACLCAVYPYLSCGEAEAQRRLGGVPVKPVGKLKNGKTIEIEIPDEACTLFVAFSKNFPYSYFTHFCIGAGTDDIKLYTKSTFNPALGNAFVIFDENGNESLGQ